MSNQKESPCLTCVRVAKPADCENKNCKDWREWWLARWAKIHRPKEVQS